MSQAGAATAQTLHPALVGGTVTAGFEPVARAFHTNVASRGDDGASCAVYHRGELVVDLWTLTEDGYSPENSSCVFSVSKGVTTICVLMAVERGLIALDKPVSTYWPEFAAAGKARLTVREVLSHRAGLAWPDSDISLSDMLAWHPVAAALAAQSPAWQPGTQYAYHALTVGWLAGELLRRATGLRPAQWLEQHVAGPLGLRMRFGADLGDPCFRPMTAPLPVTDLEAAAAMQEILGQEQAVRALSLGGAIDPLDLFGEFNRADLLGCEIPAGNLVTSARSLARLYAATVNTVDGVRLLAPDTVRDARLLQSEGQPFIGIDEGNRWGTGFMLDSRRRGMAGPGSFGHDGAGGHLGFGHLEHDLGFGYVTTRPGGLPDDRAEALSAAVRTSLAQIPDRSA